MTRLWPQGEPVQVEIGPDGTPTTFQWDAVWHPIAAVANRWQVRTSWWAAGAEAWQEYIKLTTTDGLLCVLTHDLRDGTWRLIRLYD